MTDLAAWLTTQLDADAATVGAVRPDPDLSPQEPIEFILAGQDITVPSTEAAERHIREFADPARVLREIDSKRRMTREEFVYEAKIDGEWGCGHDADEIAAGQCPETSPNDILALRLLALPYAARDGYQEGWTP